MSRGLLLHLTLAPYSNFLMLMLRFSRVRFYYKNMWNYLEKHSMFDKKGDMKDKGLLGRKLQWDLQTSRRWNVVLTLNSTFFFLEDPNVAVPQLTTREKVEPHTKNVFTVDWQPALVEEVWPSNKHHPGWREWFPLRCWLRPTRTYQLNDDVLLQYGGVRIAEKKRTT